MANKPITMLQIKRILQLKLQGYNKSNISKSVPIHRTTLDNYLKIFESSGKSYSELMDLTDQELNNLVYHVPLVPKPDQRLEVLSQYFPDFVKELKSCGVTRQLLWEEYKQKHPDGYAYSQFCEHLSRYLNISKATMHLDHQPGEMIQVDFAGAPLYFIDRETGELIPCPVLVCTLPFSGYGYVEPLASAKQEHLFNALSRCMEFLGGVPRNIMSDNMKQIVHKNERYEFSFQELASQWALYYNTNLVATRPRKPKDKATVENNVYISYLRIYARIRKMEFYSLDELREKVWDFLDIHNQTKLQKQNYSRQERFLAEEKAHLSMLPAEPFGIRHTTKGKVQMNYHVVLGEDKHQYSVPYQYIGKTTTIIYDEHTVEIYIDFLRIACHKRDYRKHGYTTLKEHMPEKHQKYDETAGWDAEFFMAYAKKIGICSIEIFNRILASKEFVQQTFLACKGLKRLADVYGFERFESACKRAINSSRVNYSMIKNILENNLDKQTLLESGLFITPDHDNIRGPEYYN